MRIEDIVLIDKNLADANLGVAVSGGRDSMVLLDLLCKQITHTKLFVLHFNHNLRQQSDAEAKFVQNYCIENGLNFVSEKAENLFSENGSLEMLAREARYKFFIDAIVKYRLKALFMGHHFDDQAETVMMRLLKGTGVMGLASMMKARELINSVKIHRPLLSISRQKIDAYANLNAISYCEDSTNSDENFLRNHLRHSILPVLHNVNSGFAQHLCDLAEETHSLQEWIAPILTQMQSSVIDDNKLNINQYVRLPKWPRSEILRKFLIDLGCVRPTRERIKSLDNFICNVKSTGIFEVGGGLNLEISQNILRQAQVVKDSLELLPIKIGVSPKTFNYANYFWQVDVINNWQGTDISKNEFLINITEAKSLMLRSRQSGDYILLGNDKNKTSKHKKLKRFLIDKKIDKHLRNALPLLARDSQILLIPKYFRDIYALPLLGDDVLRITYYPV